MCGSMNDVLGLGKLEKFSTCWSHAGGTLVFGTFRASGPLGQLEQGRIAGGDCKTVHARAPAAQPVKCIISENPPTSGLALVEAGKAGKVKHPWDYLELCGLWSVVDEPSLGQRTKKVGVCGHVGGGEFARGAPGTGCFDLTWAVGGGCERSNGTSGTRSVSESLASSLD